MSDTPKTFVHLHVHSAYSLAEGAIKVKDLVKMCQKYNMPAVAITDTNNMFGGMEFALEAVKAGIQPIIGCQINIENFQIVLLVQNEQGYRNLCRIVSDAFMQSGADGLARTSHDALREYSEGLICLSGSIKGEIETALLHSQREKAEKALQTYLDIFKDRFYFELQRHGWTDEERIEESVIELAYAYNVPLVATNDSYFVDKKAHQSHDALLCIAEGRYITEENRRKVTPEHYFKSPAEMIKLFEDVPEAILNTEIVARRCSYLLKPIAPILPPFETESKLPEKEELEAQAKSGLQWRIDKFVLKDVEDGPEKDELAKAYWERLDFELNVINRMGYPGYFLICSDFIKWAKAHNIPVGPGRGSGAGSVVAWALQITDLDPLELGLLFERFLNPDRVSMPDFDVDFCQDRRDEVIKYVQDRYGHDRVAQIITFGKLQARAVVRDVGRVLQLPYGQVDRLAKLIPNNPANPMTLQEALDADADLRAERDKDEVQGKLIDIALQLEGLYRHASTHAAGVVIGDRPLHELIPLYRDPRSDMPVTQFNMKYVEQAGLVKFDFLGLKTMTVIQKSVDMINQSKNSEANNIEILDIPLTDEGSYQLMARGDTVGVFQLESAGMRDALRKVKPDRFGDIIALVSLYRPGPMDNIPKYVSVKEGKEDPDYMHPILKPYLEETYGIMIYQEQVMQAAQSLAGYTLGGADLLRRAMGKKIKEEMDQQRKIFIEGAANSHNVPNDQADYIFEQINKFAGYGFNKSHAAAYALIAYWTAWLKANYPLQFMAASMTLDKGNTDKLSVFKQDMDKMGLTLLPPDINKSDTDFIVEGDAVRYALSALKGVGEQAMRDIITERNKNGPFKSVEDFAKRLDPKTMNRRQFDQLIAAGVFDSLNTNRAQMSASTEIILRYSQSLQAERDTGQVSLFGDDDGAGKGLGLPPLEDARPWDGLEKLAREFSAVGFYLSAHPLDTRQAQFERLRIASIAQIEQELKTKASVRHQMAGILMKKQEKMSQKGNKYAFLQLSDPTGIYEVTLFSEALQSSREILEAGRALLLEVDAEVREEQIRFTCHRVQSLDQVLESKIHEIHIHLDGADSVPKIKQFLDIEGKGRSKITIFAHLDDGTRQAEIQLLGAWNLSAQARNIIRGEKGVLEIAEK